MKFDIRDVTFDYFSAHGPGGQKRNKCKNCVRATHVPTGIVVQATKQRFKHQNEADAVRALEQRLARVEQDRRDAAAKERHDQKPDAAFGHAIRTYRFCGNEQGVVDHRSGVRATLAVVTRGQLDGLIMALLRKGCR